MRGRGLKHPPCMKVFLILVAPHAGAWIETHTRWTSGAECTVAPHAGAWIETAVFGIPRTGEEVAPHAGAWIETR